MQTNYELQQYFLDIIKEFLISNPDKTIDNKFIYSTLIGFNVDNIQGAYQDIGYHFREWIQYYHNNNNINVFQVENRKSFLWFTNGNIKGNEIKLYVPLDINHLESGTKQLFDFISATNIEHQSKIANIVRNDNVVIRVNNMEDAKTIIDYVYNNPYLKEGLMKVNPFLPTCNGIGITMDNTFSYNSTVCTIICDFFNQLKKYNRLDMATISELNKYIKSNINNITDLDLKDIYSLISKSTDSNFKLQDFVSHANYKLSDKYTSDRKRIVDPKFYFEQAIKVTHLVYPENPKQAILQYLKGNANYFTNQQKVREGLVKYVHIGDVISLMRAKLIENNIEVPNNDIELTDRYLDVLLRKEKTNDINNCFEIIKNAYFNTLNTYGQRQARVAIETLLSIGEINYFTNKYNDRNKLKKIIRNQNIKQVMFNNIDINNLDINNIKEIVNRFEETLNSNNKVSHNVY